ncbi:MAG TPA: RibD family protein [Caulobacteraceae bacterium]|jgi:diaminohydroxyphosphoribosylaminopyrimidine deaminase/5-amino-6-(5-phosphoribosylamino)uracil reductase
MRVTVKLATSLDGRIATASGESRWITGPAAREEVHRLRLAHMAVMIGVDTAIADDPELTVRLPGKAIMAQPCRIVLDSRLRLPLTSKLVKDAGRIPTVVLTTKKSNKRLTAAGVRVVQVAERDGRVDPGGAVEALERLLVPAVMIEGGGQVAASFLSAGLVDAIEWFRAPIVLGDEGRPAVAAFVLKDLASAPRFKRISAEAVGDDLWERYERI